MSKRGCKGARVQDVRRRGREEMSREGWKEVKMQSCVDERMRAQKGDGKSRSEDERMEEGEDAKCKDERRSGGRR